MKKTLLIILVIASIFTLHAQTLSDFIVIDQFGYRPSSEKIAVIRDPQTGFDATESFTPGATYALVDATNDQQVLTGTPTAWNGSSEDASSGDKAWWFDFSSHTTAGTYYVLDVSNDVRSYEFEIREDIYNEVLKQAVRTFFYQRVGHAKETPYAEANWADGASHMGSLQDTECRSYDDPTNASTERDVSGGWYDAGDYNKYTNWTSNYVYEMLLAYEENPQAWGDDYNIPESGNGIADIIDEAKWGMDHLLRMQKSDGSMISIVDESHASPPSSATGQSLYGDVNTSSTWNSASTFAYGAKIFESLGMTSYAATLEQAAIDAWTWAEANPNVVWRNNDAAYGSDGIGAGQQETDDYGRTMYSLRAAAHLYEITGDATYKTYFDNNYTESHMIQWHYVYPYESREQQALLYYTTIPGATTSVSNTIISRYNSSITGSEINLPAYDNATDPYMAYLDSYTWGSNNTKSNQGSNLYNTITYNINTSAEVKAEKAAEHYLHYIHGVNPLNKVYLTNMYAHGGDNCADQIYHTWFYDGTDWDETGVSAYGPAPGFVPGGPNPSYDWDGCCPNGCGSTGNNARCYEIAITPPKGQPAQKSYLDFNNGWPLNSWSVTENSCGYQIAYIRLLSKFIDEASVITSTASNQALKQELLLYPNPTSGTVQLSVPENFEASNFTIYTALGTSELSGKLSGKETAINIQQLEKGVYIVKVDGQGGSLSQQLIIK